MKNLLFAALAIGALSAFGADQLNITHGWQCQPLDSKQLARDKAPKDKIPEPSADEEKVTNSDTLLESIDAMDMDADLLLDAPEPKKKQKVAGAVGGGAWSVKLFSLTGMLRQVPTDQYKVRGNPELDLNTVKKSNFNVWYKRTVDIPADWRGSHVTFDVELQYVEVAVFVNGKFVAAGGPPSVRLDVTEALKFGQKNEFRLFFSSQGYGTGPGIRYQGRDECVQGHFESPVCLTRRGSAIVDGVWADTSVRKGEIALQYEIYSFKKQKVSLAADIFEDAGRSKKGVLLGKKLVKHLAGDFDLNVGTNVVRIVSPWKDAVTWELERPFLYNCAASATDGDGEELTCPEKFIFGFREVWRDGRNIMLNGHVQHYRGFWGPGPKNLADIKKFGFNTIFATHQHASRYAEDPRSMEELSRAGIAKISGTPAISPCWRAMPDPRCQEQFARFAERWAKSCRNYPCVHGASVGVNMMCAASWVMGGRDWGRHRNEGPKGEFGIACRIAHGYHPNALYFAHGDGNIYDVGTANFYFNWTPLQEREEWYETWSKIGEIPCYPAEFGAPYYGTWFPQPGHVPVATEMSAVYFGKKAYERESPRYLEVCRDFAYSSAGTYYGGSVSDGPDKTLSVFDVCECAKDLHRLLVERVTRTWRVWGQAISPMYLDAMDWEDWENGFELKCHRRYNGLCVAYIGGDPWHTDKTRAYYGGEEVKKCFAYVWDGFGDNTFKVKWEAKEKEGGKTLASGALETPMKAGETKCVPFSFKVPAVTKRTTVVITAKFDAKEIDDTTDADTFELEVYPPLPKVTVPAGKSVALFDPRGETAVVFDRLGLAYAKVGSLDELLTAKATHLVVGRRALDKMEADDHVERLAAAAEAGKQVFVMAQYPSTWQKLGFKIEDSMPRQLWDTVLPGLDERDLSFWRGLPLPLRDGGAWTYGADWGQVQEKNNGSRLWRWYHTHALASEVFQISTRTVFRPLVRGECDLAYSPLLRAQTGAGSATMCSFDFYRHLMGSNDYLVCPAAELTARVVLADFLADHAPATKRVVTDGEQAKRLAECLGLAATPWDGKKLSDAVLLLGADAAHDYKTVTAQLGKEAQALVVENEAFATSAGFALSMPQVEKEIWTCEVIDPYAKPSDVKPKPKADVGGDLDAFEMEDGLSLDEEPVEEKKPFRPKWADPSKFEKKWTCVTNKVDQGYVKTTDVAAFDKFPFAGIGPQLLRWHYPQMIRRMQPQKGWTVAGDGVFAISADGKVLIDLMQPFKLTDDRKEKKDGTGLQNVSASQENLFRRYSLVLQNWGVKPSSTYLTRAFTLPPKVKEGEKAPTLANLYWTECPSYDPYWFCLW